MFESLTPMQREVLVEALDAFQKAERYGALLTLGDDRRHKFERARVASAMLHEAERAE